MIQIDKINYTFNRGSLNETKAISDLSLNISKGEFIVVLGSNGSGKSSLLNLIAGTIQPEAGSITLEENDITHLPEHKRCKWIARVFQNPLLGTAPELSILENFRLASLRTKTKGFQIGTGNVFRKLVKEHISELGLGLESKIDQAVGTLSGGQRQSLTLSMAVMDEAKILLMDEPTAALDPKTSGLFMEIADRVIKERNLTCLLITHQLKDALNFGQRVLQLKEGKIVRDIQGDKKEKLTQNELFAWFSD